MASGLKATAPASISNINCGYDCLGAALDILSEEIIGRRSDKPGVQISITGPGKQHIPLDPEKNTAGVAILRFFEYTRMQNAGVEIAIHKRIGPGSGLGSSASSACAAVTLVNGLFDHPLNVRELFPLAVIGESVGDAWHADNVAPCLFGGVQLIRDFYSLDTQRLSIPSGLCATIIRPEIQILTSEARAILQKEVPLKKVVSQSANLAALVLALERGDFSLLAKALQDHIIEPQRAHLIPGFPDLKEAAYLAGALAFGISGAGPSLFAFSQNTLIGERVAEALQAVFVKRKIESQVFVTKISAQGAELC